MESEGGERGHMLNWGRGIQVKTSKREGGKEVAPSLTSKEAIGGAERREATTSLDPRAHHPVGSAAQIRRNFLPVGVTQTAEEDGLCV